MIIKSIPTGHISIQLMVYAGVCVAVRKNKIILYLFKAPISKQDVCHLLSKFDTVH